MKNILTLIVIFCIAIGTVSCSKEEEYTSQVSKEEIQEFASKMIQNENFMEIKAYSSTIFTLVNPQFNGEASKNVTSLSDRVNEAIEKNADSDDMSSISKALGVNEIALEELNEEVYKKYSAWLETEEGLWYEKLNGDQKIELGNLLNQSESFNDKLQSVSNHQLQELYGHSKWSFSSIGKCTAAYYGCIFVSTAAIEGLEYAVCFAVGGPGLAFACTVGAAVVLSESQFLQIECSKLLARCSDPHS
ncbi:hypothetical protein [Aquimarina sp. 2201CG14-23]|uniref:hypothetical protein n=1 Tax=Aquimarina mycalae TaxID=3040073 RepID=UPI0024780EFE|nr:hypothetical protein [Aquimarina sp. 2201CG14-23]MDH7447194.1 hypothetical protein [Aquimarina sp. 2201CG14-23]